MDLSDDICFYYKILYKHNNVLKKNICTYIQLLTAYICSLEKISQYSKGTINKIDFIQIPCDMYYLLKNLIPEKCEKNMENTCNCLYSEYEIDCRGDVFLIIDINENNKNNKCYKCDKCDKYDKCENCDQCDKCDKCKKCNTYSACNKCNDHDKYTMCNKYNLKHVNLACLAKYQNEKCEYDYLQYSDILCIQDENFNIDRKINQYIGFKIFFSTIIELLDASDFKL